MNLTHILNWELKAGSHEFPGPDGGTCINEAAIVAAGFEYRKVKSWEDCPSCFSPTLSAFAIVVNDCIGDRGRRELMPLVTRLAGSRDDEEWVERARAEFIMREVDREVVDLFDGCGEQLRRYADGYAGSADIAFREARRLVSTNPPKAMSAYGSGLDVLARALRNAGPIRYLEPASLIDVSVSQSINATEATLSHREIGQDHVWRSAAQALTRAFRIGTQAPIADTAKVLERIETAKAQAREREKA